MAPARRGGDTTPAPAPGASRRLTRIVAAILLTAGVLAVTESALTLAWQEPITALVAHREQAALEGQLDQLAASPLRSVHTAHQDLAGIASRLERRTSTGDALGRIRIPRLDITFVFVAGTGSSSLKKGPGHYDSTDLPGQGGTVGLAGHRTTYLAPFKKLDRLRRGDEIALSMPYGRFLYKVEASHVVLPSRIAVLRQTARERLVLTTCTPMFSAAKRLVIVAARRS